MQGGGQIVGTSCLGKPSSEVFNTDTDQHRHNFGGGGQGGDKCPPPSIFLPKNSFVLATELKSEKKKIGVTVGKKGCMYIKDWVKPIFPL